MRQKKGDHQDPVIKKQKNPLQTPLCAKNMDIQNIHNEVEDRG